MKTLFTLISFLFAYCLLHSTTYYFSATGNDANSGTSSGSPWQTITKFNSFFSSLSPGDNVLFNQGDVFYGAMTISRSGSAGNPITIGSYGSGAAPVITGFY